MFIHITQDKSKLDNLLAKMIKYSAIEIWSKIPQEIKKLILIYLFLSRHEVHSMNTHTLQNAG